MISKQVTSSNKYGKIITINTMTLQKTLIKITFMLALVCLHSFGSIRAQNITYDNAPPFGTGSSAVGASGGIVFNFTTNKPITILNFRASTTATTVYTASVWYNATKINGQPIIANMTPANGWIQLGSAPHSGAGNAALATIPVSLSLDMNPGDTFGFFLQFSGGNVFSNSSASPYIPTYSNGTVTIIADSSCAFTRNATTWFGPLRQLMGGVIYKERVSATNNASVSGLVSPVNFCQGNQDIKVRIQNKGSNVINSLTVNWELDNIPQTPISWTSPLDTLGGTLYPNDTIVTLGSVLFGSSLKTLKVWTSYPNSVADTVNLDDTLYTSLRAGLTGAYNIGGTTPDFNNISDAVAALNQFGVCGPVGFTIDPNTPANANEITINSILGASSINTITFKGNGRTISTTNTNPTIRFNGASWITLDSLNIVQSGTTGFGIQISNASHHITIKKCSVTVSTTSTATTVAGIVVTNGTYTADGNSTYITIDSNVITGGYANLTMFGSASYTNNYGSRITNNKFLAAYMAAIYVSDADTMIISGNDISRLGRASWTTGYGIRIDVSRNIKILQNRIHDMNSASAVYPIYLTNNVNSVGYETEIINNAIYNTNSTSTLYGIYSLTTALTNVKIFHNTIQLNAASGTGVVRGAFFAVAPTNVQFRNNIISLTGAGTGVKTGIYVTTTSATFSSNNNAIYLSGGGTLNVGYWGAVQATLGAWQTASSQDLNSVVTDPQFVDLPAGNLRISALAVDNFGAALGISTDILGLTRSLTKPDIGAFESYPPSLNNAGVKEIIMPTSFCTGLHPIKARIVNAGLNVINSVTVNWSVNGVAQTPVTWTNPIDTFGGAGANDTLITLGQFSFSNTPTNLTVFTSFPNSVIDTFTINDSVQTIVRTGLSGGYTIGAGGSFTSLTDAFAALSTQICDSVIFELQSNYVSTGETFPLTMPQSATVNDSIIIRPQTGASGLLISGNNATAILDLNGADYVTIDGRPGGLGTVSELSIVNNSTSGATIRFINSASNNRLRYLNITGNSANAANGAVFFSDVSTGNIGNNNNQISDCAINGNGATVNCIYSSGSIAPADNQNISIVNCNIFDFFSNVASTNVSGITLAAGSSNWNITGNRFYQTAVRNSTSTPALTNAVNFKAVFINNAAIGGCSITNNIIGGNILGIPSSVFVLGDATTANGITARLIDNNVSSPTVPNSIQGNTIANINMSSTVTNSFIAIHGRQGIVNIGNVSGNTIGSQTGTGSIMVYYNGTATNINLYAIRVEAASGQVSNNIIGSMSAETRSTGSQQLLVIYGTGTLPGALTISQNIVGGTTQHSLQSTSGSVGNCNVMGIVLSGANANLVTINNNLVRNLSNLNVGTSTTNGVKGIYLVGAASGGSVVSDNIITRLYSLSTNTSSDQSAAVLGINNTNSSGSHLISNNLIYGLHADAASAAVHVIGVLVNGTTTTSNNVIERNRIYGLAGNSTNGATSISGINMGTLITTGKYTIANNMISLGLDTNGASLTAGQQITGIIKQAGVASILHNSVYIGGTGVDNTINNSFAYRSVLNAVGDSTLNNLFVNLRANATGGGTHYAVSLANATNLVCDYNLYYTSNAPLAVFNSINQPTLSDWKSLSGIDANSVSLAVNFVSFSDLHLTGASIGQTLLAGIPLPHVNRDYDNANRSASYPYKGADENIVPVPVVLSKFTGVKSGKNVVLQWTTASEKNNHYFEVQRSTDNRNFEPIGTVKGNGNSSAVNQYVFNDVDAFAKYQGTLYYRLKQVDYSGAFEWSNVVSIHADKQFSTLAVAPNPFIDVPMLLVAGIETDANAVITVYSVNGRVESVREVTLKTGNNNITLDEMKDMATGIYLLDITIGDKTTMQRIVKYK
jgi:hypothetical protein